MSDAPATAPADADTSAALDAAAQSAPDPSREQQSSPPSSSDSPRSEGGDDTTTRMDAFVEGDDDVDISDLPDATQAELKKLRREAASHRSFSKQWEPALSQWDENDIATLREALELGPSNREAIGEWMLSQARSLLGDRFDEVGQPADTPQVGDPDGEGGTLTKDDVERLVNERLQEVNRQQQINQKVAEIRQQSTDAGFGPGHPMHEALLSVAKFHTQGDIPKAAELLRESLSGAENNSIASDSQPGAGSQATPGAGRPVPPSGDVPVGNRSVTDPRKSAAERISAVLGNRQGFNDPR